AGENVDLVLVDQLARLGQRGGRRPLVVLDDELDLAAAGLAADLVEVELGPIDHVLADLREGAGHRREEADLDRRGLRAGRRRRRQRDEKEREQHDGEDAGGHAGHADLLFRAPRMPWGANRITPMYTAPRMSSQRLV